MSDSDRLSNARTVEGLHAEPSALDRQAQANPVFNQAAENAQKPEAQQGRNSEMIEKDGSRHNMRPPEDMARVQDRQGFSKAWTGEQRAAARVNELHARYGKHSQTDNQSDQHNQTQRPGQRM